MNLYNHSFALLCHFMRLLLSLILLLCGSKKLTGKVRVETVCVEYIVDAVFIGRLAGIRHIASLQCVFHNDYYYYYYFYLIHRLL